eukprot:scaffold129715_cov34-Prasinocladus_malaysianus.AAC.2
MASKAAKGVGRCCLDKMMDNWTIQDSPPAGDSVPRQLIRGAEHNCTAKHLPRAIRPSEQSFLLIFGAAKSPNLTINVSSPTLLTPGRGSALDRIQTGTAARWTVAPSDFGPSNTSAYPIVERASSLS